MYKIDFKNPVHVYFIGIGGISMSGLAQMALAWVLKDDNITSVLIGASKAAQILDNIKAIENTSFTEEELKEIDR